MISHRSNTVTGKANRYLPQIPLPFSFLSFQPVGITYGSQLNVMLRKDSTGGITGIIMPNQAEHYFEYRTYFNSYRLIYSGLHTQIWEYDSRSNLQRIYFPYQRLITYKYDENNRLISSFTDGCRISYQYSPTIKTIRSEYPRGQIHEQNYEYNRNSHLQYFIESYQEKNSYLITLIHYWSKNSFQLRLISSKDYQRKFVENYAFQHQSNYSMNFHENTGYLQSNSFIRLTYPTLAECFIKDYANTITISRRRDEYKRLKEISFIYKNEKRLTIELIYNNKEFLLEQMRISLNDLDKWNYLYQYDHFKRLIQIKRNDLSLDQYQYDLNNNLNHTKQYSIIQYNQWNQILQIQTNENSTINYQYDSNGFLHYTSNNRLYLFNSFGLLIKYKSNQLIIDYIYDHEHRLIMKSYPLTGIYLQLIYGNQENRKQITHIFHSQMKVLTTIFYDNDNHLIGFEQNGRKYFVITDAIGSPLFIYDENGMLVEEKLFGLYGNDLIEKNYQEKIFFPLGFAGLFVDDDLHCAFEGRYGKIFDLHLGRYLVPHFPSSWMKKQTFRPDISNPFNEMNLYQINDHIYNPNEIFFQQLHQPG